MASGGVTCCVPGCNNNNKRNKGLSFHRFPSDKRQRKLWLLQINRQGTTGKYSQFIPTANHRVCGMHFIGGRRQLPHHYPSLNLPNKSLGCKNRNNPLGNTRSNQLSARSKEIEAVLGDNSDQCGVTDLSLHVADHDSTDFENHIPTTIETECEVSTSGVEYSLDDKPATVKNEHLHFDHTYCKASYLKPRPVTVSSQVGPMFAKVLTLHKTVRDLRGSLVQAKRRIMCIESMQANPSALHSYTGFSTFSKFMQLFTFLEPDIPNLIYPGGSKHKTTKISPQDSLLLTLCRYRTAATQDDLAYR